MNSARMVTLIAWMITSPSWSFSCFYTLAKDSCWTDYDVSTSVIDSLTGGTLFTVTRPKGQHWIRRAFECNPNEKLMFSASFSPEIWEKDKGKTYKAKNFWFLPDKINPGDSAWEVSVCYPAQFADVPLPPKATSDCQCDFSSIPVIPPKQLP